MIPVQVPTIISDCCILQNTAAFTFSATDSSSSITLTNCTISNYFSVRGNVYKLDNPEFSFVFSYLGTINGIYCQASYASYYFDTPMETPELSPFQTPELSPFQTP